MKRLNNLFDKICTIENIEEELISNTYSKNIRVIDIQLSNRFFIIHFYYYSKPYWLKSCNKKLLKKLKLYERTQKNNV